MKCTSNWDERLSVVHVCSFLLTATPSITTTIWLPPFLFSFVSILTFCPAEERVGGILSTALVHSADHWYALIGFDGNPALFGP